MPVPCTLAVSNEKALLSFKLLLGDLVTTPQQVQSHTVLFSGTIWHTELQDIFQAFSSFQRTFLCVQKDNWM